MRVRRLTRLRAAPPYAAADLRLWNEDGEVPTLMAHDGVVVTHFWQSMGFRVETDRSDTISVHRSDAVLRYDVVASMDVRTTNCVAFVRTDAVDALHVELGATRVWQVPVAEPGSRTDGFDARVAAGESIARLGAPVDREWGMREIRLFDPSNNLIRIAQAQTQQIAASNVPAP